MDFVMDNKQVRFTNTCQVHGNENYLHIVWLEYPLTLLSLGTRV